MWGAAKLSIRQTQIDRLSSYYSATYIAQHELCISMQPNNNINNINTKTVSSYTKPH